MTMSVPGSNWSDLIYEIAAWFARDKPSYEIADPAGHYGRASALSDMPSLPSNNPATDTHRWRDGRKMRIRFTYPVGKDEVDWKKLERAVLGENIDGGLDGGCDCPIYGNDDGVGRESGSGNENDHVDEINQVDNHVAGGSCGARSMRGSLWIEIASGSAVLGELRGELGRLDKLGLLQVSCR